MKLTGFAIMEADVSDLVCIRRTECRELSLTEKTRRTDRDRTPLHADNDADRLSRRDVRRFDDTLAALVAPRRV